MDFTKQLARLMVAVSLLSATPAIASAEWIQGGILWNVTPSGSSVGDCFGNCGAGCGDAANPCRGPRQYWDLEFLAGPDSVGTFQRATCTPGEFGNEYFEEIHERFQAIGRWTYYGQVAPGCIVHDFWCTSWMVGCFMFAGCGSPGWPDSWSYDEWMEGTRVVSREYVAGC